MNKTKTCRYAGVFAMLVFVLSVVAGCIGYSTNWDPSWTNKYEHEKRHLRALWQDMADMHRFIDRYLLNFDENDPARY